MIRLYALLVAAALALSFWAGWSWRGDRAEGAEARQQAGASAAVVEQVNKARVTEHTHADTLATIGAKHEEDRTAAETVPAAVVAELRAGTVRLRHDLATCHTGRLDDKIWWVEVDRHLDDQHRGRRLCTSYEQGVIGSELWAVRHQQRLRLEIDQREVARAAARKNRTW